MTELKIRTTAIIAAVIGVVAFTGVFYMYQLQNNDIKSDSLSGSSDNNILAAGKTSPVQTHTKPPYATNGGLVLMGKITFHLIQNSTTLKATQGTSVTSSIPINIVDSAPMRFVIDDRDVITSKPIIPSGISISMLVYGKQYQPIFYSYSK